jgi:hypothetical protein
LVLLGRYQQLRLLSVQEVAVPVMVPAEKEDSMPWSTMKVQTVSSEGSRWKLSFSMVFSIEINSQVILLGLITSRKDATGSIEEDGYLEDCEVGLSR